MGLLSFIFGAKKREVQRFLDNDAMILDVRTDREYQNNHIDKIKKKRFKKYLPLSLFFDNDDPSVSAEGNSYKDSYITYFQKEDKYVKVAQDSMVNRFFSDLVK